jgi:hypothetical protein
MPICSNNIGSSNPRFTLARCLAAWDVCSPGERTVLDQTVVCMQGVPECNTQLSRDNAFNALSGCWGVLRDMLTPRCLVILDVR